MRSTWMANPIATMSLLATLAMMALVASGDERRSARADETPSPAPSAAAPAKKEESPSATAAGLKTPQPGQTKIGRPVRIVSLSFYGKPVDEIAGLVDVEGAKGADLIILPETWTGKEPVPLDGPLMKQFAALAKKHRMYIVNSVYRKTDGKPLNSAVLIDRQGNVAGIYDKVFPYWSEWGSVSDLDVGREATVVDTDFGRLGFAICFDVNFPEVWSRLADKGAEVVVWPSAYKAGRALQAHAINHHYYIVTSTWRAQSLVYDITGDLLLESKSKAPTDINVNRVTLDLDRRVYHENFNWDKAQRLLKEHDDAVQMDVFLEQEQWFVLKAKRPGIDVMALAREYGLEEHRDYIVRSRAEMDRRRSYRFIDRVSQLAPDVQIGRAAAAEASQSELGAGGTASSSARGGAQ